MLVLDARRLIRVMSDAAARIGESIPSIDSRRLYASTGLSSHSCRAISRHVQANARKVSYMLVEADPSSREDLIDLLLEGLAEVREMEPRAALAIDAREVLTEWCNAVPVRDIAEAFREDPQVVTEFIEDYFSYRLPWGISGYLGIAATETATPITSPWAKNIAGF